MTKVSIGQGCFSLVIGISSFSRCAGANYVALTDPQ